jgi:hypothetical protein
VKNEQQQITAREADIFLELLVNFHSALLAMAGGEVAIREIPDLAVMGQSARNRSVPVR